MNRIKVNEIELAYERTGHGKPLMLLHGYPLDHHIWDSVIPLLKDKFDLILPDLRGFGLSTTVEAQYTMDDFASDLVGLLDHLSIETIAMAGHSMGGYVALAFARLFPKRIHGLALVASQVLADPPERKEGRYKSAAEIAEKGIQGVIEIMSPKFTPDVNLQTEASKFMQRQPATAYIGALKAMAERKDASDLLQLLDFPIVIVHGNKDELVSIERAREVKSAIPRAHLVEIHGAGHLPMMEAPQETASALSALL